MDRREAIQALAALLTSPLVPVVFGKEMMDAIPVGQILPSAKGRIPEGWAPCDGRPIEDGWAEYRKALEAEGLTKYNTLPDFRGMPVLPLKPASGNNPHLSKIKGPIAAKNLEYIIKVS